MRPRPNPQPRPHAGLQRTATERRLFPWTQAAEAVEPRAVRARRRVLGCADAGAGLSGGVRSLGPLAGPVVRRGRAAGLRRAAPVFTRGRPGPRPSGGARTGRARQAPPGRSENKFIFICINLLPGARRGAAARPGRRAPAPRGACSRLRGVWNPFQYHGAVRSESDPESRFIRAGRRRIRRLRAGTGSRGQGPGPPV